jgi:hypothetical protein
MVSGNRGVRLAFYRRHESQVRRCGAWTHTAIVDVIS